MSQPILLARLKQIVRGAAEFGINEAGTRALGQFWPLAKEVLKPIFQELEKRYPALFLAPGPDAVKAAEKALKDLTFDASLQKQSENLLEHLDEKFAELGITQDQILKAVTSQEKTLQGVGAALDKVALEQGNQASMTETLLREFRELALKLDRVQAAPENDMTIAEIAQRANEYQYEAMRWLSSGDPLAAARRVKDGKTLALGGFKRDPGSTVILATLGYLEKTEAQIAWESGENGDPAAHLGEAAKYFGKALETDPEDVSALNGLADLFIFAKDFDRAITLGTMVVQKEPTYGAAALDLSIALEGKISEVGPLPQYVTVLEAVYKLLEQLIPLQPMVFDGSHLAYVQKRLKELESQSNLSATED